MGHTLFREMRSLVVQSLPLASYCSQSDPHSRQIDARALELPVVSIGDCGEFVCRAQVGSEIPLVDMLTRRLVYYSTPVRQYFYYYSSTTSHNLIEKDIYELH